MRNGPLEKLHVDGAIRIDGVSNLETATATLATTTQSVIDTLFQQNIEVANTQYKQQTQ